MGSAAPLAAATLLTLVALVAVVLSGVAAATAPLQEPLTPAAAHDWAAEVERLRTMPCPAGTGSAVLFAFVGADPAWTAELQTTVAEHRARCSG